MSSQKPHYQAIFFDLDGTAIPNRITGMPSPKLLETVAKYRGTIHLMAATGRSLIHALPVIEALGLTDPCIISGGTIIIDPVTTKILKRTTLPAASADAVLDIVKDYPAYPAFFREERIGTDPKATHRRIIEDADIIYLTEVMPQDIEPIARRLALIPHLAADPIPSWTGNGDTFTITHDKATKEHAVAEVLRLLNVPPAAAIGVGDGNNDVHLFRSVGLKVAMANASTELKAAADIIAPALAEDGLATIIEQYA